MSKMLMGACIVLLAASPPALAQDLRIKPIRAAMAKNETLDASMARLAVKAALQPSAHPTQQELLGVILLMSLRERSAARSGT